MVPEQIRRIKYSEFPDLPDSRMAGAWNSWKRKKTMDGSTIRLLKIDGQRAVNQFAVNNLKVLFDITPMKVELVFDEEEQKQGVFIDWVEAFGHIGKMNAWYHDTENMKELISIVMFDAIIGNNDRMVTNVLVRKDFRILAIDEGECFRFASPTKCRFNKGIKKRMGAFVIDHPKWFLQKARAFKVHSSDLRVLLMQDGIDRTVADQVRDRAKEAESIATMIVASL